MSESGSVHAESTTSHDTGITEKTNQTYGSHGTSSVPLGLVPAYQHLKESNGYKAVQQLPSHRFQYSVWHDLREACLTGTMLKAPRVRKGPEEVEEAFYQLKDEQNQSIHHSFTGKAKDHHKEKLEDWEHATTASFCFQEMAHGYQKSSLSEILKRLRNVEQLYLTNNEIQDLSSHSFPKCVVLSLNNNYISSFKKLPDVPKIKCLSMEDNDVDSFKGLTKLRSTAIEELNLNGNPVCFKANYRQRVFQTLTSLKILDGVQKLPSDLEFQEVENQDPDDSDTCTIL